MKNKPTPEQVEYFKQCVVEFSDRLNMRDWRVQVSNKPASKGSMADCSTSLEDRLAVVRIGSDWGDMEITSELIRETSCHELLHPFLAPLLAAAMARDQSAMQAEEHSVITVLEKLLCK
jgi:hypothetical protein